MHELIETLVEGISDRLWRRAPRRAPHARRVPRAPRGPRVARGTYVPVRPRAEVGLLAF